MTKRKNYRNGDAIELACGCDGCSPMAINGVLCHEAGCPDEWRDYQIECVECGCDFWPSKVGQRYCSDHCACMSWGCPCECEICLEVEAELIANDVLGIDDDEDGEVRDEGGYSGDGPERQNLSCFL